MIEFVTSGAWWMWFHAVFAGAAFLAGERCKDILVGQVAALLVVDWGLTNLVWSNSSISTLFYVDMAVMLWVGFKAADSGHKALGWILWLYVLSLILHISLPVFVAEGAHIAMVNVIFDLQCAILIGAALRDTRGPYRFPWWHDRTNRVF